MLDLATADRNGPDDRPEAAAPTFSAEKRDGAVVLVAGGDWLARTIGSVETLLQDTQKADLGRSVTIDIADVTRLDTSGAYMFERLRQGLETDGRRVEIEGVGKTDEALFEVVRKALEKERPEPNPDETGFVTRFLSGIGGGVVAAKDEAMVGLSIVGGALYALKDRVVGRTQARPAAIVSQMDRMGVQAVPIIVLMTFLIGGIIAQQGAFQLRRFGGELYAVNLVGILVLREIGVLLTAIMVAGRTGSAITAEIGSMKMREEVDALHVMGLGPISVLVFPRLVALIIVLPLLSFLANLTALLGAMMTLQLYSGISPANFLQGLQSSIDVFTIFAGLIKAPFMALIIGIVAAAEGMRVGGSAESLGARVTASVVKSIFLVILVDGLFAILYASLGL
ncbi:ABC transporter permease [Aurantimonas sp. Leaf443]|uniref:ABC transporter permease n=1 Tax=Aurantimonas sp. Leaf443 TaxID=1736378 RepID=UPI0006F2F5BB|nr:ABC transporter permease [Aurantimonas sp. Leaf443]KQT86224.1 organic solvent ABC transporter permease [Aurantimonas sp. Leaf443]